MDKIIPYIKKYGLWILVGILVILAIVVAPFVFISKKPIDGITKAIDVGRKQIDKIDTQIEIKKVETVIKNETVDKKKEEILKQLEVIKTEPDMNERRKKVIELHEKIKKFK